ncbi:MAG: ATP-binding protein [Anaerovoracaceae bacterium]|jgi:predicted AAA+ superfamily ATPase
MSNINSELSIRLNTLTIFRGLLDDPVISDLKDLLWMVGESEDTKATVSAYSAFAALLYEEGGNLSSYMLRAVLDDENFYVKMTAAGRTPTQPMEECLDRELELLQEISQLQSSQVTMYIGYHGFLPSWDTEPCDLPAEYRKRLADLPSHGFGIFAKYHTFSVKDGHVVPVKYPDTQRMDQLFGYERERQRIITNTMALIEGRGCNNMLLYGDAGTGKSSTIKAVANEYADRGLRLVEIKKNQLFQIPEVVEELSASPLKFIIYIDDLSFSSNDDNFSTLKAMLEGSVSTSGDNIAIYATSNRRHLLKETMADREGDELHINDTLQETMSLAARFGLTITFQRPGKEEYLHIVDELAKQYGVEMDSDELHTKAEAHATRNSGRSPRTAKQFIELLKSGL